MSDMNIKALAPWFGGKRNLAPMIVDLIGKHRVYWEVFCGGMAVLLLKPPCEMETVNDLHGDLINLARIIQDEELGLKLYEKLYRTLYAEEIFKESKTIWTGGILQTDFDRAFLFFVVSWMGINGFAGTKRYNYQFALRWCVGGGQGATRWQSVVGSIPAWHKRLKEVVIINRDAFEVLEKIKDEEHTAIYCDPPYFNISSKYLHEFSDLGLLVSFIFVRVLMRCKINHIAVDIFLVGVVPNKSVPRQIFTELINIAIIIIKWSLFMIIV